MITGTGEARIFSMMWRVESSRPPGVFSLDQQGLIFIALGLRQGAADVLLGDGMDGVVDDDLQDFGGGGNWTA